MLTYRTSFKPDAPGSAPRPSSQSPYKAYGANHQDVLDGLMGKSDADYAVAQGTINANHDLAKRTAENQLVLQGLQQMSQAQQNATDLGTRRFSALTGMFGGLLGGLFNE
jgi:hypothetical protein